jgi:hypothetical protein
LQNLKEITLSTHTPATVLEDSLVAKGCEYLLPYLPGNGAKKSLWRVVDVGASSSSIPDNGTRKELDVYERFYSCRQ